MQIDPAALIVAITGAAGLVVGVIQSRKGRADAQRQAAAAEVLEGRQLQFEEQRELVRDLRAEADRAYEAREQARAEIERTRERHELRLRACDEEIAELRRQLREAVSDMTMLKQLVHDEVEAEASRTLRAFGGETG